MHKKDSGPFSQQGAVVVAITQGLIDSSSVQFSTVIGKWEISINQSISSKAQSLAQSRHGAYFGIESHCIQQSVAQKEAVYSSDCAC